MKNSGRYIRPLLLAALLLAMNGTAAPARNPDYKEAARFIHEWNRTITNIMIDDGWSPPIATRHYANANVAAYEAAIPGFPACRSLEGQLNGLKDVPRPDMSQEYDWRMSAIAAYKIVAQDRLFRAHRSDSLFKLHAAQIAAEGVAQDVIDRSVEYGTLVGKHIVTWMRGDGYIKITANPRYVIPKGDGMWEPTEPDFKEPADPFWNTMRTMALENPGQYRCDPPLPFDPSTGSEFYKQAMEVYTAGRNLTDEQRLIALYWNDNPVTSRHFGHIHFNVRWMTPPGHWISITGIGCRMKELGMMESLETYTLVAIAMYDGFISCWNEKYRSNVVRPITYIHRYIDSAWAPLIQTPPFPEHTSGHSTISAAAATVLTRMLGEFPFEDNTSTPLDMPVRKFGSFMEAAREAAISRLYGGIHYRRANEAGAKNGAEVGDHVVRMVRTRI